MKGQAQLIAMRSAGKVPVAVWVTDSDDTYSRETARDWHQHANISDGQHHAHLRIEASDIPDVLDLRCVVGLNCHIATDRGQTRFERLFEAFKAAGARAVIGVCDGSVHFFKQGPTP